MKRSAIPVITIILVLSAAIPGAEETPVDVPLPAAAERHAGEIQVKRAQMERALALHPPDPKNWAPVPDPSPIDVIHYELDLALDLSRRVMSGTAVVDVAAPCLGGDAVG